MKTLIIALLISSVVSGQVDFIERSYQKYYNYLPCYFDTLQKYSLPKVQPTPANFEQYKYRPKQDTIQAMLLISDTSNVNKSYQVFAIKGYQVLENGYQYNEQMMPISMKYLVFYLDSNKKPLPKTWVVWQAKWN